MAEALAPGTLLNDRFKIRRIISQNTTGAVYLAHDVKITERLWTVREFLPPPGSANERLSIEEKFREKVQYIKSFDHPHLIRVLDEFQEGNRTYLITEYIDGFSLEAVSKLTSTPISEKQVLEWAIQICRALEYLHGLSIPYFIKDLNPRHIIADRDNRIKVGGYGLDAIFPSEVPTDTNSLAPELTSNSEGTAAADVYSLATCLYFLLTLKPYENFSEQIVVVNEEVSKQTNDLVMSCLSQNPESRPSSATILRQKLDEILHPLPPVRVKESWFTFANLRRQVVQLFAFTIYLGVEAFRRPYYLIFLAMIIAVLRLSSHYFYSTNSDFKKTGPLFVVFSNNEVEYVDPTLFKIVYRIYDIGAAGDPAFQIGSKEIWIPSQKGTLTDLNVDTARISNRFSLRQEIGGVDMSSKGSVYVTLVKSNLFDALSSSNGLSIGITPVGSLPRGVALNENLNEVYVANSGGKSITIVSVPDYRIKQVIRLDASPSSIRVDPTGNFFYVSYVNVPRADQFDAKTKTVSNQIMLDSDSSFSMSVFDKGLVLAAYKRNSIMLYDQQLNKTEYHLNKPRYAMISAADHGLYACGNVDYFFQIDAATGQIKRLVKTGQNPHYVIYVP